MRLFKDVNNEEKAKMNNYIKIIQELQQTLEIWKMITATHIAREDVYIVSFANEKASEGVALETSNIEESAAEDHEKSQTPD